MVCLGVFDFKKLLGSFYKLIQPCQDCRGRATLPGLVGARSFCRISENQEQEQILMQVPFSAQENSSSVEVQELSRGSPASYVASERSL